MLWFGNLLVGEILFRFCIVTVVVLICNPKFINK